MNPFFSFLPIGRTLLRWACAGLGAGWALGAQAQVQADWSQIAQRWVDNALQTSGLAEKSPLRLEVNVGAIDPQLRLAPCARVEPYLPVGAKLWGRTRLGLRCAEGAVRWNVFLPVTVQAFGPAWVLTGNVSVGTVLTQADAVESEVDWAAAPTAVLADPALWVGQVAARHLAAGQPLRQNMVKAPQLFPMGAQVRVSAQGPGFAINTAGQALSAGSAGQNVRIRMANGKIIEGIVLNDGTISALL